MDNYESVTDYQTRHDLVNNLAKILVNALAMYTVSYMTCQWGLVWVGFQKAAMQVHSDVLYDLPRVPIVNTEAMLTVKVVG